MPYFFALHLICLLCAERNLFCLQRASWLQLLGRSVWCNQRIRASGGMFLSRNTWRSGIYLRHLGCRRLRPGIGGHTSPRICVRVLSPHKACERLFGVSAPAFWRHNTNLHVLFVQSLPCFVWSAEKQQARYEVKEGGACCTGIDILFYSRSRNKVLLTFFTAYSVSACCVETYSALICDVKSFSQVTNFKTGRPEHKKLWDDDLRAIIPGFEGMQVSGSI